MAANIPEYGTPEYKAWAYERAKVARRGNTAPYINDKEDAYLAGRGYTVYVWPGSTQRYTNSFIMAKERCEELRKSGHFARMYSRGNRIRYTEFVIYSRPRK